MNLEQVLIFLGKNLHEIINTSMYSIFEQWCKSGNDSDFDQLIEEIKQWKSN